VTACVLGVDDEAFLRRNLLVCTFGLFVVFFFFFSLRKLSLLLPCLVEEKWAQTFDGPSGRV